MFVWQKKSLSRIEKRNRSAKKNAKLKAKNRRRIRRASGKKR